MQRLNVPISHTVIVIYLTHCKHCFVVLYQIHRHPSNKKNHATVEFVKIGFHLSLAKESLCKPGRYQGRVDRKRPDLIQKREVEVPNSSLSVDANVKAKKPKLQRWARMTHALSLVQSAQGLKFCYSLIIVIRNCEKLQDY